MIQWMLAVLSLVPLPFINTAWTYGSSWFTYCWSLAWRILSINNLTSQRRQWHPHSSTLAWKIPWTEEPGGLQSMGSLWVGHDFTLSLTFHFHALEEEMANHSSILVWRIPGTGEPGGLPPMGSHRVGHDWSDLAAAAAAAAVAAAAAATLLVNKKSANVWYFEHFLVLPFFEIGMKTDLFQSCGHCWVFQIHWHIECKTLTAWVIIAYVSACLLSCFSCVQLFVTLWTVAQQAPLSMGFSRQDCWSGLPCPPPGYLPDPGIKPTSPVSPALLADSLLLSHKESLDHYLGIVK